MNLTKRSVSALRPHKILASVPSLPDGSPEFVRLIESVREYGIIDPIKITASGHIVDGRHRVRALACLDPESSVWCLEVADEHAAELALETLSARRHLITKGQLAYFSFPLIEQAYRSLTSRHSQRLNTGIRRAGTSATVDDLAAQIGVSRDEFFRAAKLHALFAEDERLREEWEPKILAAENPVGLGAVISGIAGAASTRGASRAPTRNTALARWDVSWGELGKHARAWDRWTDEDREHASQRVRTTIASLPTPLLDVLRDALKAARRARSETDPEQYQEEDRPVLDDASRARIAEAASRRWSKFPTQAEKEVA